jgi:hypothetical protein
MINLHRITCIDPINNICADLTTKLAPRRCLGARRLVVPKVGGSFSTTLFAVHGPVLVTTIVKLILSPAKRKSGGLPESAAAAFFSLRSEAKAERQKG